MLRRSIIASVLMGGLLAGSGFARPVLASFDEVEEGWEYRLRMEFAPLAVDARSTVNGQSASFVTGSSDFLGLDTTGFKIRGEAWKGRWGITADSTLASFSAESRIDSANTVTLDGRDLSVELGGSYLLGTKKLSPTSKLMVEGMGGARFVALNQELEFTSGVNESDRKQYVDPFVGARATWVVGKTLSFDVRGNAGGFGIGSGSELTWMIMPELNLHLSKSTIINVGYRHYDVRTEEEGGDVPTQFDGAIYGTFIGVEVRMP